MRRAGDYVGSGPGDARRAYGTMTFRDELPQLAASKVGPPHDGSISSTMNFSTCSLQAFKTVVPPIALFEA